MAVRVIVADTRQGVADFTRSALAVLALDATIIETPTLDAALQELGYAPCDLLIALPDDAEQAQAQAGDTSVVAYTGDITAFVRDVSTALGRAPTEGGSSGGWPIPDLGSIPGVDMGEIRGLLGVLLSDVGAMAAVFADRAGNVLATQGAAGYIDQEAMTVALAPHFASIYTLSQLLGEQISGLHFWNAKDHDVYGLSVGLHYFMYLVYEGKNGQRQQGAVSRWGRKTAEDMIATIGKAAYEANVGAGSAPAPAPARTTKKATPAAPAKAKAKASKQKRKAKPKPKEEPKEEAPTFDLDDDALANALETADDVDLDAFWGTDKAGATTKQLSPDQNDDKMSFEDALGAGLLDLSQE